MRIKYPWLRCATNALGQKGITGGNLPANASWDAARQIPLGHIWVHGEGAWTRSDD